VILRTPIDFSLFFLAPTAAGAIKVDQFGLNLTNVVTLALFAFFINPQPAARPGLFAKNY